MCVCVVRGGGGGLRFIGGALCDGEWVGGVCRGHAGGHPREPSR